MEHIEQILKQVKDFPITKLANGFKLERKRKNLSYLSFKTKLVKLVLPLREGEFIKHINNLPLDKEYSISYPGTASMKSIILFTSDKDGIFIGGTPTYEWAKIKIKRTEKNYILITYNSNEHSLYFIRFKDNWRQAADKFKKLINQSRINRIKQKPKYLLQIGVKDSFGNSFIKNFNDLRPVIDYFKSELGADHIVHFFGTNKDGFDRMAPDYTIAPEFGGEASLKNLISYIKQKGLRSSHHYNPRIADANWIKSHPGYKKAAVTKKDKSLVIEPYKDRDHYFMNPNNNKWFRRCLKTIKYLKNIGFDYIQLDQFTYQRNFYNPRKPLHLGYKKMMEKMEKMGINYWLEGVSDVHRIKEGNFYQILTRDRPQVWEDNENRRGYPYGVSYPSFFMYLYPDSQVSYQLVTEKNHLSSFHKRLHTAKKINASIYDLQMTFYDKNYLKLLQKIIEKIKKYDL